MQKHHQNRESHTEQVSLRLPKSLNVQFRQTCARLGISLNEAGLEAIRAWLEKH